MYSIWYKRNRISQWTKFKDTNDYHDALMIISNLRTILSQHAIVRYF